MENIVGMAGAAVVGLVIGFIIGKMMGGSKPVVAEASSPEWWKLRETLTGTQLQILQYMEAHRKATIAQLQEKFSFIPDRELYYRLEQIVLMDFMVRGRADGEVVYELNDEYSSTVESDKTVMMD